MGMKIGKDLLGVLIVSLVLASVPFLIGFNQYYILIMARALIFAVFVVAWNIIGGYAGQLDLAAFAYIGLGGIVAAQLLTFFGLTPWVGMFVGAVVAIVLAVVIGYPTFRFGIKEVWYALLTSSLVVILNNIFHLDQLLGSLDHYLPTPSPGQEWLYIKFPVYEYIYWVIVAALAVTMFINIKISNSKTGYYLRAIREDELAAEALGIDVRKYKLKALISYAGILGFMGYLFIVIEGTYSYHTFNSPQSIMVAIMGIIGGLGSIGGAFTSALLLKVVEEYLRGTFGSTIPGLHLLLYGVLLILVGIFKPDGLAGIYEWFKKKYLSSRGKEVSGK